MKVNKHSKFNILYLVIDKNQMLIGFSLQLYLNALKQSLRSNY